MSIVIGDAVHAGASGPVVPPAPPPLAGPFIGTIVPVLVGWTLISGLIARRIGLFRKQTVVGPERTGRRETPWLAVFLFFAAFSLSGLLGPAIVAAAHVSAGRRPYVQLHVSELLTVVLVSIAMTLFRREGLARLGLSPANLPRGLFGGGILILTLFPLVTVVGELTSLGLRLTGRPQPLPHQVLQALHSSTDHTLVALAVAAAVFTAPLYEELLFRGCAQTAFSYGFEWMFSMLRPIEPQPAIVAGVQKTHVPEHTLLIDARHATLHPGVAARWCAILVAAVLFAAVHGVWAFVPPLLLLAIGLGFAYEMTGNLWVTIVAHALFNTAQILIFNAAG